VMENGRIQVKTNFPSLQLIGKPCCIGRDLPFHVPSLSPCSGSLALYPTLCLPLL
jgi:hypothetical protein